MDKSWLNWVNENLQRKCDPQEIANLLLQNKFSYSAIRTMMGKAYPEAWEKNAPVVENKSVQAPMDANALQRKCTSLLEIQRDLARLSPKAHSIERRSGVSGNEFLEKYYAANRPVILCDLMTYWQANQKWTPEYLKKICGNEIVEIVNSRPTNPTNEGEDKFRKQVKFSNFLTMAEGKGAGDCYLSARNKFFNNAAAKPLLKDIEVFTEYLKETNGDNVFLRYGCKGTGVPLRHEEVNMLVAQVKGRMHIKIIPANEVELVYNNFSVYSQVNALQPNLEKFPKFQYANVIDIELHPGEVLFLPVGWWYWVHMVETSIAVAFSNFLFPNNFRWEHPK